MLKVAQQKETFINSQEDYKLVNIPSRLFARLKLANYIQIVKDTF